LSWPADTALAQSAPVPPCAGTPVPVADAAGEALNQLVWIDDEVPDDWNPPACTGWQAGPTKVLLAAAGRFSGASDSTDLAARLTRISALTDLVYWSSSRSKWRNLFKEAMALTGPDRKMSRPDFSADELAPHAELYYWLEEDNPTAGVVYQMLVHERAPGRLVFETVNVTPIKAKLLFLRVEVAEPGELRQLYYFERERDDIWHYYTLIRMGEAGSLVGTSAANYRNRTEAYFRFIAGLRMDREPPAAP
jgi:hypothetical protein